MTILSFLRHFATKSIVIYYTQVDPRLQKYRLKLKGYNGDIKTTIEGASLTDSGIYCIFVYYETDGKVSRSVQNILETLQRQNINIILVTNANLSERQSTYLTAHTHTIVLRGNQGFDFGAYQDCINHLRDTAPNLSRLIILNDSVYYFSKGIESFVQGLMGEEDSIAAFENWDPIHAYHLQSFALSVSGDVFRHPAFESFWKKYIPINNRLHAIERGEKKLSEACLKASSSTRVIYSTQDALTAAETAVDDLKPFEFYISTPVDIRSEKSFIFSPESLSGKVKSDNESLKSLKFFSNIDGIYRGSPIHAGMMFFSWYTDCPTVKKDIIYREQFRFWEVDYILRKRFDSEEIDEFLTLARKKGTLKNIDFLKQVKARIGAA